MLRICVAVLFLVSSIANAAGIPEPQNKAAFNNFKTILSGFFIKRGINSAKSGKKTEFFQDVNGSYSSVQLYREYKQNELVANKKYKGKKIRVHGTTESVTENFIGQAVVKTESPDFFLGSTMYNVDKEDPYVLNLVPGSKVDMVCVGAGFVMDSPILNNCVSTDSYIETQIKKNINFSKVMDGLTYLYYIPNEDILGKECHTTASCNEFISIIALLVNRNGDEYTEKNFTEDEKKEIIQLVERYEITEKSISERTDKMKNFVEKYKTEFEKRFGFNGDSKL
ncbi:hypothetical protein [Xenorhabdus sp. TS4]|uniref:OB-fold protein n=1 Tax=Xenorhabdus sp. TS4 TaxID=1873483 RepID=UPI001656F487|nr:hypothetical protein [Xenorhabdus sp. TS4]MBC8949379.1 hypothetical protein [Xenorhabdus sp. TS4]